MPQNHQNMKTYKKKFEPLPKELEIIGKKIVDAAYTVHKTLGPGLLEKVYEICFCHELTKRGLKYLRQIDIPIVYDGITFQEGLRLDVLVAKNHKC
jgi:GxxExxY protein